MVAIKKTRNFKWGFYIPFEDCDNCSIRDRCEKHNSKELEHLTKRRQTIADYIKLFFPVHIYPSPVDMCKELGIKLLHLDENGHTSYRNNIYILDSKGFIVELAEITCDAEEIMYKELTENGKISIIINMAKKAG